MKNTASNTSLWKNNFVANDLNKNGKATMNQTKPLHRYIFCTLVLMLAMFSIELFAQSTRPLWIDMPYSAYSDDTYLVAVGDGVSRLDAENTAFANLVKIFGTRVQSDARSVTRMSMENQGSSEEVFQMDSSSEQKVGVTASHYIENMSIEEFWQNPRDNRWSALALLPKQESARAFAAKIDDLNTVIQEYLDKAEYEAELLHKFSLVDMAAIYAQECENLYKYYNVLSPILRQSEHNYRQIMAKADSIAQDITFSVDSQNDNSLTQFAIEEMLGTLGMRMDAANPDYIFKEKLTYQGTDTGFGVYLIDYIVNIELVSTSSDSVLSVFTFKGKEGGSNEANALKILQNALAKDIANGNSELGEDSLVVQFTVFLDNSLE